MIIKFKKVILGYFVNLIILGVLILINIFTIKIDWQDVLLLYGILIIVLSVWEMNQNVRTTVASSPMTSFSKSSIGQDFNHIGTMNTIYEQYDEYSKPDKWSSVKSNIKGISKWVYISFGVFSIIIGLLKYIKYLR